jgi:UDP-N-acetylmuramoyl-tripeptide--D-alanyl-D-alanine ligase
MIVLKEILKATNGTLEQAGDQAFSGVSTDSRHVKKGDLFIPIKGEKFDGHRFIEIALKGGAAGALTSKKIKLPKGKTIIYVKDTLKAFHQIAKAYKERFDIPFIGITGSSGKTTTKDMLASILSRAGKTLKTEENFNNEIGVPQTLLKLKKTDRFAVIEMAMQGMNEIEELARIVRPNIAVITNIGSAHIGLLGSGENVAKAKSEILNFQTDKDIAILPANDKHFNFLKNKAKGSVLSFGIGKGSDISAIKIVYQGDTTLFTIRIKGRALQIKLPLPGEHNIYDALAAAAAACSLGIRQEYIKKGLESFKLSSKRLNIIKHNNIRIIDDTYNANPDSMSASLIALKNYPPRRIAVLGDMLELGKASINFHENIGRLAAELKIDELISVGKLGRYISNSAMSSGLKNVHSAASNSDAIKILKSSIKPNDTVLIKGSRGMKMETIVESLAKRQ